MSTTTHQGAVGVETMTVPCGGCGAKSDAERCIGCLHDFGDAASAWTRNATPAPRTDGGMTAGEVAYGAFYSDNPFSGPFQYSMNRAAWERAGAAVLASATPAQPAGAVPDGLRALSEAAVEAASATYYDAMMGQEPHTYGWAGKPEAFKAKVRERMAMALTAALTTHPAGQNAGSGAEPRRMAEGCCSAVSPCSHQQRDPYSLCAICQKANGLTDKIQAGAPDSTRTGQGEAEERLIGPKMTPEQEARIAHNLCGEFGPDAVIANASFVKAFYAELYAAARPAAPEAQGAWSFDMEAGEQIGKPVLVAVLSPNEGCPPNVGEAQFDPKNAGGLWWWAGESYHDYHGAAIHPYAWRLIPDAPAPPASSGQEGAL